MPPIVTFASRFVVVNAFATEHTSLGFNPKLLLTDVGGG